MVPRTPPGREHLPGAPARELRSAGRASTARTRPSAPQDAAAHDRLRRDQLPLLLVALHLPPVKVVRMEKRAGKHRGGLLQHTFTAAMSNDYAAGDRDRGERRHACSGKPFGYPPRTHFEGYPIGKL